MHKFSKLIAGMRKEIEQQNKEIIKLSNKVISLENKTRGAHEVIKHATLLSFMLLMVYILKFSGFNYRTATHILVIPIYPYTQDPEETHETAAECYAV